MKKITDYAELSAIVSSRFGRDYVSNYYLTRETVEKEIEAGKMFCLTVSSSLFILRERETHFSLLYSIKKDDESSLDLLPTPTVTETAFRERDRGLIEADEKLCSLGFEREFYRARMTRAPMNSGFSTDSVRTAGHEDIPYAISLLSSCFSPLTGCLPDEDELCRAVDEGGILLHSSGGLLHYTKNRLGYELRHLCVDERARGRGVGGELVSSYCAFLDKEGAKGTVWVREGYTHAWKIYEKNGYRRDGYRSSVLIYGKDKTK